LRISTARSGHPKSTSVVIRMPLNPNAGVTQLRRVFNNMSGAEPPPSDARFEAGDRWNGQGGRDSCRGKSGEAVLFLIHGGGYIFGAPRTHRTLLPTSARREA
jgi:acetyl esterase/lipase